jgi:ElaA protein
VADERRPVNHARFDELSNRDLYEILQLRSAVFVVEQDCVFLDIDGRDHEPATEHLWIRDERGVAATARILHEHDDVWSIGRVVAHPDVRSTGLAARLMIEAVDRAEQRGARTIRLGAQAHLEGWYGRFGFAVSGPGYVEDGIPHVPMLRVRRPT